jgi:hypothetical protein
VAGRGAANLIAVLTQALSYGRIFEHWKKNARLVSVAAGLAVTALIAGLAAIACAVAALWIYLIPYAGPVGAPLIVAGALLALCVILSLAAYVTARRKQKVPSPDFASAIKPLLEAVLTGFAVGSRTKKSRSPPKDK